MRAVADGEHWFPRTVLAALYDALLVPTAQAVAAAEGGSLSRREAQVLGFAREGLTNKEIARRLEISSNTVKKHLASAFQKQGLRKRRQITLGPA